jgi:hypothetical protein
MHKLRAFFGSSGKFRGRNGAGVDDGDSRFLLRGRAVVVRAPAGRVRGFRYDCQ